MSNWKAIFVALVAIGCADGEKETSVNEPQQIQVVFGKNLVSSSGLDWPETTTGLSDICAVESPANLTITLPSGQAFSTYSKLTFCNQKHSNLVQVEFTPLKDSRNLLAALDSVETVAEQLGFAPDSEVRSQIVGLRRAPPQPDPFHTISIAGQLEQGVEMLLELKPVTGSDSYFVSVALFADVPETK